MGNPELPLQWSYSTAPEVPGYVIRMKTKTGKRLSHSRYLNTKFLFSLRAWRCLELARRPLYRSFNAGMKTETPVEVSANEENC